MDPIKDEGDVLIENKAVKLVLECHESGPEIVFYLGFVTVSLAFAKSVVDLIKVIIEALCSETNKVPSRLRIVMRRTVKAQELEEKLVEIDLQLDKDNTRKLNSLIRQILVKIDDCKKL